MKKTILAGLSLLLPFLATAQAQPGAQPRSMADAFMMLDSDKDGKVSKTEFLAPYEKRFAQMDSNHDGAVDRGEIEALEKAMRARMEQMRKQQPPAGQK
ncbi:hypothetical protein [Thiolapillus sp.]